MVSRWLMGLLFSGFIIFSIAALGCGKQDWGYLRGKVTLNGQPVGPGSMSLQPANEERAGAVAVFGQDGIYSVMSAGRKAGARVGEYRVIVFNSEDFKAIPGKIPSRYSDPNTSDLTVTIEPGDKTFDFDLKQ